MEPLLGDIADLHKHHVSAPHESQDVDYGVEVVEEDVVGDEEFPHQQGGDQDYWEEEFHYDVLLLSDQGVGDEVPVEFKHSECNAHSDQYNNFNIPLPEDMLLIKEPKVITYHSTKRKQGISGQTFINRINPIQLEVPDTVLIPQPGKVGIKDEVHNQEDSQIMGLYSKQHNELKPK